MVTGSNRLKTSLGAIELDNPVIPASGTFGYGREYKDLYDLNILGAMAFKGTTLEPRFGNPQPRIAECPGGMLNAVGLQNPGLEAVIHEELPQLAKYFHKPLLANISGFSIEEYITCARAMDQQPQVTILEVNISCPNVHGGGLAFGTDPAMAAAVTRAVKEAVSKPVYIKLSPNVTDIAEIAAACQEAGADGLALINTVLGMRIDPVRRIPLLANGTGGLSGPAIFPIALQRVYQTALRVNLPIIGIGGISSARDVIEMMMAGADAVEVGAANLVDPFACRKIIDDLPREMDALGIETLQEIKGAALCQEK
ncbi:MAG: dihydroorotate dehydrogenase [Eubacteriales bacterium]|nr:dihydroorotate dehydrogenase [Eubacteriales bacterium]